MKQVLTLFLIAMCCVVTLQSCKEDDEPTLNPQVVLDDNILGTWELYSLNEEYKETYTYSFSGEYSYKSTRSVINGVMINPYSSSNYYYDNYKQNVPYSEQLTLHENGTYIRTQTIDGKISQYKSNWTYSCGYNNNAQILLYGYKGGVLELYTISRLTDSLFKIENFYYISVDNYRQESSYEAVYKK